MKLLAQVALAYLVFVVQLGAVPHLAIGQITPNLLVIVVLTLVVSRRLDAAVVVAGFGGLLFDLFSPLRFGVFSAVYLLVYIMVQRFLSKYAAEARAPLWFSMALVSSIIVEIPTMLMTLDAVLVIGNVGYTAALSTIGYFLVALLRPKEPIRLQ